VVPGVLQVFPVGRSFYAPAANHLPGALGRGLPEHGSGLANQPAHVLELDRYYSRGIAGVVKPLHKVNLVVCYEQCMVVRIGEIGGERGV